MQNSLSPVPGKQRSVALIGYSGHAWVVAEALLSQGRSLAGYCEKEPKLVNPLGLPYLGWEEEGTVVARLLDFDCVVAIGDNKVRKHVTEKLVAKGISLTRAVHAKAVVSGSAQIGEGAFLGPLAVVNAAAVIGAGAICNSASVVEHECRIGDFAHIGPCAVLTGGVEVGERTLIGAGTVIRPGTTIGANALVGAGSVVVNSVADNMRVAGNPARPLP